MRKFARLAAVAALLIGFVSPAAAQQAFPNVASTWYPQDRLASNISVTTSSAPTLLPANGDQAWVCNIGSNDAYVAFGGSSVSTLSTSGSWVKAGSCAPYSLKGFTGHRNAYIAAITASSTTTLQVETGAGTPPLSIASSGGGSGGNVNLNQVGGASYGLGSALSAASMPVVIASDQGAVAIKAASGSIASGAVASGAVAAGAVASGAAVDGWNVTAGAKADAACASPFTGSCSEIALLRAAVIGINGSVPVTVNGTVTPATGLTPGVAQTGTIVALNADKTSVGGTAIGAMANFGTTPGAVKVEGVNASLFMGTAAISATNGIYSNLLQGNAVISATNGLYSNLLQGNAAISATNGLYANLLQGNAVISATNGLYANLMVGNAAVATGTGAQGATTPRFAVATDSATNAGAATVKGGVAVVNGGSNYQAVAASQTATVLQTSTGATGDYLSHCDIYPTSTSPGVVTVFDNTNTAANSAILFPGGASSVSNLVPFPVPVGANSINGAWKVTTGANVSVACYGKFS